MTILNSLRELYSLDTLDTRFTTPSSTPPTLLKEGTPSKPGTRDGKTQQAPDVSPPRWKTPEFFVYLLVFLFCVPQMYWAVVSVSQRKSRSWQHMRTF
jgi:protein-cysteine N-palmitoyltransferase HHAT